MRIRRWMQVLIVGIVVAIIGVIIYVVIQPRRLHTDHITEGKIFWEQEKTERNINKIRLPWILKTP